MTVSDKDRDILRGLAEQKARIAALPVHEEKAALWTAVNDLKPVRPMVWMNEVCWNEMNVDDELTLQCEGDWARGQETELRRELYQWTHMPGDMIVRATIASPYVIHDTGFGIREESDIISLEEGSSAPSRHFHIQIKDSRFARTTMAMAFQRTMLLTRRSISRLPG